MHSVLFQIGPVTVYGYGFMIAVGVISAFVIAGYLARRLGLDGDILFNMGVAGVAGGIVGAKLLYYIVEFDAVVKDPSVLLDFGSGFVVYGGLIAGILCPMLYARVKKVNFWPYLDCAVVGIAFAQGCGRIGCFLAGCCYGKQTDAWFGVVFPENCLAPAGVSLIPTQLISAAGDFIFSFILLEVLRHLYKQGKEKSQYTAGRASHVAALHGECQPSCCGRGADECCGRGADGCCGQGADECCGQGADGRCGQGADGRCGQGADRCCDNSPESARPLQENSGKTAGGLTSGLYIMLYAAGRFAIEFLRDDPRGSVGVLSTSQFIAIFMFAAGVLLAGGRSSLDKGCIRR